MRISTVCCARTPNLEIAFFSGDFLTAGGAFPWRRQDRNGATLDFAQAQHWTLRRRKVLKAKFAATKGEKRVMRNSAVRCAHASN